MNSINKVKRNNANSVRNNTNLSDPASFTIKHDVVHVWNKADLPYFHNLSDESYIGEDNRPISEHVLLSLAKSAV